MAHDLIFVGLGNAYGVSNFSEVGWVNQHGRCEWFNQSTASLLSTTKYKCNRKLLVYSFRLIIFLSTAFAHVQHDDLLSVTRVQMHFVACILERLEESPSYHAGNHANVAMGWNIMLCWDHLYSHSRQALTSWVSNHHRPKHIW